MSGHTARRGRVTDAGQPHGQRAAEYLATWNPGCLTGRSIVIVPRGVVGFGSASGQAQ